MALQDTALRLIRKFGEERTVTLQQPSQAPVDPSKPWEVDPTTTVTSTPVPAVVVPIRRNLVDGNSVQQGDETAYIAGVSFGSIVPTPVDTLLDEGVEKTIVNVDRIKPGKTDFLYKLQLRTA